MPSISFVSREPIQKGWSDDKKYRIGDEKEIPICSASPTLPNMRVRKGSFST